MTIRKFSGGSSDNYIKQQSTTHLGSNIDGLNVTINTTGKTTIKGSRVSAKEQLSVKAAKLELLAANDSNYSETKTSSSGFLSSESTTTKKYTSTNVATSLSGGSVSLTTTEGDIDIIGSNVSARDDLAVDSAGDLNIAAGYNSTMDETQTKSSSKFSGGSVSSESDDLEGNMSRTAVLAQLNGGNVTLKAKNKIALIGVNASAKERLSASAKDISVENAHNEEKSYSRHTKTTTSMGDVAKSLTRPDQAIQRKDGKLSVSLAKSEYNSATSSTTKTTVVSSSLSANNLFLNATSDDEGGHHNSGRGKV